MDHRKHPAADEQAWPEDAKSKPLAVAMIVNLKLETEARCELCGRIGIVERSQMLCFKCFGYWIEYVNWLRRKAAGRGALCG